MKERYQPPEDPVLNPEVQQIVTSSSVIRNFELPESLRTQHAQILQGMGINYDLLLTMPEDIYKQTMGNLLGSS